MTVNIFQSGIASPHNMETRTINHGDSSSTTTSSTWTAMSPSIGITMKNASNKVLVILHLILSPNGIPAGSNSVQVTIFRGATNLFDANAGCAQINTVSYSYHDDSGGVFMHFVDTPGAGSHAYWTYARSSPAGIMCQVMAKTSLVFEIAG